MIDLPDVNKNWEFENGFFLTCKPARMAKLLAHYELFKQTLSVPGAIVECGVFKGASLSRFAMYRDIFGGEMSKLIVGFDTFGLFPDTNYDADKPYLEKFINEANNESISCSQLIQVLEHKKCDGNIELIEGDICQTVPEYVKKNPHFKISLLNLDTDIYEPATTIVEHMWPLIVNGGILILDDYGYFPGETNAVDEYFKDKNVKIQKFSFSATPSFIIKNEN